MQQIRHIYCNDTFQVGNVDSVWSDYTGIMSTEATVQEEQLTEMNLGKKKVWRKTIYLIVNGSAKLFNNINFLPNLKHSKNNMSIITSFIDILSMIQ